MCVSTWATVSGEPVAPGRTCWACRITKVKVKRRSSSLDSLRRKLGPGARLAISESCSEGKESAKAVGGTGGEQNGTGRGACVGHLSYQDELDGCAVADGSCSRYSGSGICIGNYVDRGALARVGYDEG